MNQAVSTRQDQPVIKQYMLRYQKNIERIMPNAMTFAKLEGGIMTECRKNPELLKCDPKSLLDVVMTCARLGLQPGPLGECYITKYGNEASFSLGYKGMITLALRSGEIKSIQSFVVREDDQFAVTLGTEPSITHMPKMNGSPMIATYAVARMGDGLSQFEVCDQNDIASARKLAKTKTIWDAHPERMARKTAIRRLFSELPVSTETHRLFSQGVAADAGEIITTEDFTIVEPVPDPPKRKSKTAQAKKKLVEQDTTHKREDAKTTEDGEITVVGWCRMIDDAQSMEQLSKVLKSAKDALDVQFHDRLDFNAESRSTELG